MAEEERRKRCEEQEQERRKRSEEEEQERISRISEQEQSISEPSQQITTGRLTFSLCYYLCYA